MVYRSQPGKVKVKAMFVYVFLPLQYRCTKNERMAVEKSMMFRDAPGVVYSIKFIVFNETCMRAYK